MVARQPIILTDEIVPPPALIRAGLEALPTIVRAQGERASRRFIQFFTANIRNRNTRAAYARAVKQFFDWCEDRRLELEEITPLSVAAYVEQLGTEASKPTVKQHLAAIRQLFDYLTTGGILEVNPAASVRGPKYVVKRGKTPVLSAEEARELLDSIESNSLIGRRDRALIGTMVYSFARVGAAVTMRVGDLFQHRKRQWLRLHEKGGKRHEVPCHPSLEEYLNAWIAEAGIERDKKGPLFRSMRKGDAVIPSGPPESRPICRMAAHSNTPRQLPTTNHPERPSFTIAPERNFRSTKWKGSKSRQKYLKFPRRPPDSGREKPVGCSSPSWCGLRRI